MSRKLIDFRPEGDDTADTGGADDRPAWLPEQFKTPEDLAKSYEEAQRALGRATSELDAERTTFAQALEQMEQQQETIQQRSYDPNQDPILAAYEEAKATGDERRALAIQMQLTQQQIATAVSAEIGKLSPVLEQQQQAARETQINQAEQLVRGQVDGYDEMRGEVIKYLEQSPFPATGSVEQYAAHLASAVRLAQADQIIARDQATAADRLAKLGSQTLTPGAGGRVAQGTDQEASAWKAIKEAKDGSYNSIAPR